MKLSSSRKLIEILSVLFFLSNTLFQLVPKISKRIDVVSYVGHEIWMLEVSSKLRLSVLGHLKIYGNLFRVEHNVGKIRLGVIRQVDDPISARGRGQQGTVSENGHMRVI